jgi:glutamine synthetase
MAGLDGIKNQTEPPEPVDLDLYELPDDIAERVSHVPGSLEQALAALSDDHEFLLEGGVFTEDLIETWVDFKREREIYSVGARPHPWEFYLYYDI